MNKIDCSWHANLSLHVKDTWSFICINIQMQLLPTLWPHKGSSCLSHPNTFHYGALKGVREILDAWQLNLPYNLDFILYRVVSLYLRSVAAIRTINLPVDFLIWTDIKWHWPHAALSLWSRRGLNSVYQGTTRRRWNLAALIPHHNLLNSPVDTIPPSFNWAPASPWWTTLPFI